MNITALPGDGIGPEVVTEAVLVLEAVGKRFGHRFDCTTAWVGGAAIDRFGVPLPEETLKLALDADAVLLGAVGGPRWESIDYAIRPERALLALREKLGLYANLRPATCYSILADASTLKREVVDGVDLIVVRELTGGIYFGSPRGIQQEAHGETGINTEVYTTAEIVRITKAAFELARGRRQQVTSVDKANVLESSALWRKVVIEVHKEYPDIALSHLYVDNCSMQLIRNPRQFDVIVTTNLFGDILSDEAAMLTGSIGMLPSASLGESGGKRRAMYEPIHGSAPDIAGKDLANPIATILSVAMMLKLTFGLEKEAGVIEDAVLSVLKDGYRTADIYSEGTVKIGTKEMGRRVVEKIL